MTSVTQPVATRVPPSALRLATPGLEKQMRDPQRLGVVEMPSDPSHELCQFPFPDESFANGRVSEVPDEVRHDGPAVVSMRGKVDHRMHSNIHEPGVAPEKIKVRLPHDGA